jgi:hypothetical protein
LSQSLHQFDAMGCTENCGLTKIWQDKSSHLRRKRNGKEAILARDKDSNIQTIFGIGDGKNAYFKLEIPLKMLVFKL